MKSQQEMACPLDAVVFREAGPLHTTAEDIVSGIGSKLSGGRWNPKGNMHVVYTSFDPITASAESVSHFRYYGLPLVKGYPKVTVCVQVKLSNLLDLTTLPLKDLLPVEMKLVLEEDWREIMRQGKESTSQALGRVAYQAKIQGLIVPSNAFPGGKNLLVFRDNLSPEDELRVLDPEKLDKLGKPG
jgi:RES domain-containing protein